MQEAQFKIVFNGELMPDMPIDTVKSNLARLFKTETSKVERLFGGQDAVIKTRLSQQEADKYLAALHRARAEPGANGRRADSCGVGTTCHRHDLPEMRTHAGPVQRMLGVRHHY